MLWSGQSLGKAEWFINYNEVPQEISSSIIGTLIAAITTGQNIENALLTVKMFGLFSALVALSLIWFERNKIFAGLANRSLVALSAILATAVSPVFMYWSLGGLETAHHALLLLVFCLLVQSAIIKHETVGVDWWLFGVCCLLVLVRTEAFWPTFLAGFFLVIFKGKAGFNSAAFRAILLALLFLGLLFGVRYKFTSVFWPNPVYAKVGNFKTAIPGGLKYVYDYYVSSVWAGIQALAVGYGALKLLVLTRHAARTETFPVQAGLFDVIAGGIIIAHLAFVVLSGGNWMEYFRFMAAIVPLMNILVFTMLSGLWVKIVNKRFVTGSILCFIALSFTQIGSGGNQYAGNCSKPLILENISHDIKSVPGYAIKNNCAHSRDFFAIKPFIESKIPGLLAKNNGHLTVTSSQAGFFPYYIRQNYDKNQVWFIDSAGLGELDIARLPGERNSGGLNNRIDLALLGRAGSASQYFLSHPVDLVYLLDASPEVRANFKKLGFNTILDVNGAVVFSRPGLF